MKKKVLYIFLNQKLKFVSGLITLLFGSFYIYAQTSLDHHLDGADQFIEKHCNKIEYFYSCNQETLNEDSCGTFKDFSDEMNSIGHEAKNTLDDHEYFIYSYFLTEVEDVVEKNNTKECLNNHLAENQSFCVKSRLDNLINETSCSTF